MNIRQRICEATHVFIRLQGRGEVSALYLYVSIERTGVPLRLDITPLMCWYSRSCSSGKSASSPNEKHRVCAVVCGRCISRDAT